MIGLFAPQDSEEARMFEAEFLDAITEPMLETICTPERYAEVLDCKRELDKRRGNYHGAALEKFDRAYARVYCVLRDYVDADPNKIVSDMILASLPRR